MIGVIERMECVLLLVVEEEEEEGRRVRRELGLRRVAKEGRSNGEHVRKERIGAAHVP